MKKPLWILFSVYFFVVQFVLIAWLWGDQRFFLLAGINALFLLFFWFFSSYLDRAEKRESLQESVDYTVKESIASEKKVGVNPYAYFVAHAKKTETNMFYGFFLLSVVLLFLAVLDNVFIGFSQLSLRWFALFYFVMLVLVAKDLLEKKVKWMGTRISLTFFLFISSLVLSMVAFATLPLSFITLRLLVALGVGFLFFYVAYLLLKSLHVQLFLKMWSVKVYVVFLLFAGMLLGLQNFAYPTDAYDANSFRFLTQIFVKDPLKNFTGGYLLTGNGEVLNTGFSVTGEVLPQITSGLAVSGFVDVEEIVQDVEEDQVEVVDVQQSDETAFVTELKAKPTSYLLTMMDAIVYLIDSRKIPLVSGNTISFSYVTKKNPYYAYYATAYAKKMIGKDTSPSKKISCDTYIVIKGIADGWNVIHQGYNIKEKFWQMAVEENALKGCVKGAYVKPNNLE